MRLFVQGDLLRDESHAIVERHLAPADRVSLPPAAGYADAGLGNAFSRRGDRIELRLEILQIQGKVQNVDVGDGRCEQLRPAYVSGVGGIAITDERGPLIAGQVGVRIAEDVFATGEGGLITNVLPGSIRDEADVVGRLETHVPYAARRYTF